MRINKEGLSKIIITLQDKYDSMSDEEFLDFSEIKFGKVDLFEIPEYWYLDLPSNFYEENLILSWCDTERTGASWDLSDARRYHLIGNNKEYFTGHMEPLSSLDIGSKLIKITYHQFEEYIVNRDEDT